MANEEAGGKMKNKRLNESGKPYNKRKSIVGRVTDAMKDMISPSWLVDLVSTIKKKTPPMSSSSQQQNELESSHVQHRFQAPENPHDPMIRPGMATPQQMYTQAIPQINPLGNNAMGAHPIHQMPTPAGMVPASTPMQFTSESLPFLQQKSGLRAQQNVIVNGADDQSEFSEYSVSTSGCSSMIPHPDPKDYQKEVLLMNESRIKELRQELGGSITPSRELEAKSRSDSNMSVEKEKSFLWSSELQQSRSVPQPPAKRHKPSFNITLFGNSEVNRSNDVRAELQKSPFYPGKTAFGGSAGSHKRGRLKESASHMAPTRKQVTAKPLQNTGGSAVSSSAAKRILDALDKMSSPLNDVKKIPSYTADYTNSPMSFTPSNYRRRPGSSGRRPAGGPPTQSRVTPARATIAVNLQRPGPGTNLVKQNDTSAPASQTQQNSAEYQTPAGRGGKMKRERGGMHYSSKRIEEEDEEVVAPDLSVGFTLPVNNLPKISFQPTGPSFGNAAAASGQGSSPFTFSSPITQTASAVSTSPPVSPRSFQFSSPISVEKSNIAQTSPASSQDTLKSTTPAKAISQPSTSLAFSFNPAAAVKKHVSPAPAAAPSPEVGGFKPAAALSTGSVMDMLKKSPLAASPRPSHELRQGSVMDFLGGAKTSPLAAAPSSGSSLADLFKKPTGTWDCPTCMISSKSDVTQCPACETPKPGAAPPKPAAPPLTSTPLVNITIAPGNSLSSLFQKTSGSWDCPTCMINNKAAASVCPACETPQPGASKPAPAKVAPPQPSIPAPTGPSLSDMFKKKSGTWECDTCMVTNKDESTKCIACEMPKPGCKATTSFTSPGGFKVGPQGGFSMPTLSAANDSKGKGGFSGFGSSSSSGSSAITAPAGGGFKMPSAAAKPDESKPIDSAKPSGGFKFGASALKTGESSSTEKTDNNNKSGFGGYKFGQSVASKDGADKPSTSTNSTSLGGGGFKFGQSTKVADAKSEGTGISVEHKKDGSDGFKFGQTSAPAKTDNAPSASGFKFGGTPATKLPESEKKSTDAKSSASSAGGLFSFGNAAKTPAAENSTPKTDTSATASKDSSVPTFNQTSVAPPSFTFGEKSSAPSGATQTLATSSIATTKSSLPSSGFVFGATPASTPSSSSAAPAPASTFVFGATVPKAAAAPSEKPAPAQQANAGPFVFGQTATAAAPPAAGNSTPGMFQFGAPKTDENKSGFGNFGAAKPASTVPQAAAPGLFAFGGGNKPANTGTAAPVFGTKRSDTDDGGQGPAKRGRDLGSSFGKSQSTPSFGAPNVGPAFGSGGGNPPPAYNAPQLGTNPSFQFGAGGNSDNNQQAPAGVFQFGSAQKAEPAPAKAGGFAFGQTPAAPNGQTSQNSGFNFSSSMNPSFNFSGGAAPAQTPAAAPAFQFGAAPAAPGGNPFNATSAPGKSRPVKRAVRKLKK